MRKISLKKMLDKEEELVSRYVVLAESINNAKKNNITINEYDEIKKEIDEVKEEHSSLIHEIYHIFKSEI